MGVQLRAHRTISLIGIDAIAILIGYTLFAFLRYFPYQVSLDVAQRVLVIALAAAVLQAGAGSAVRVYQGRASVASLEETVLLSVVTATSGVVLAVLNATVFPSFIAITVPVGATFVALFIMLVIRAIWRNHDLDAQSAAGEQVPTLVFGAGSAGKQLVRSMLDIPSGGMHPVGFLDDDPWKRRLRAYGVSVLGSRADIETAAIKTAAKVLVIAIPTADPALIRQITADARAAALEVKVLPGVGDLLADRVSIRDIRDINVQDLLGRGVVETDVESIAGYLTGKRVLVTGAGGSIGSELCRQLHKWGPSELMMLDRDESGLHGAQLSIHGQAMLDSDDVILADIRDYPALEAIFVARRPDVVFHAAALKHLPMLEQYPAEAMKTNVVGTLNVLRASALVGVERFVNISTDKAAAPTSVLGYSKRVAERVTAAVASDTSGTYLSVRFGNVLGSRGSVLTSFAAQIASGGPVTVTHPEVTRYFMTTAEAVQLVLQAAAIGRDGEVLILDMGQPVRIQDVAEQLIDQSGRNIEIIYTGLREGEKLHEILLDEEELDNRPIHPLVSHVPVPELNATRVLSRRGVTDADDVRKQLLEWCDEPPSSLHPEPEYGPREWSSIEN